MVKGTSGFDRLEYYADMQSPNSLRYKLAVRWSGYTLSEFLNAIGNKDEDGFNR